MIAGLQGTSELSGYLGLALTEHVAHLLRIGTQPQIADPYIRVQDVAALNHHIGVAAEGRAFLALGPLSLDVDVGHEPGRKVQVCETLTDVPGDIFRSRHSWSDDTVRKGLCDDASGEGHDMWIAFLLHR